MYDLFFLGSDRLPHCDGGRDGDPYANNCGEETYYSGETIKFLLQTKPFKDYWYSTLPAPNGDQTSCSGMYYSPGEPGYVEGMHPPLVYGSPKIKFSVFSSAGTLTRYATLDLASSNIGQGQFEYHYTISSSDNGSIQLASGDIIVSDSENKIVYILACSTQVNGQYYQYVSENEFSNSYVNTVGFQQPEVNNVTINVDSGSVTESQVRILLKRSSVTGKIPTTSNLLLGELAANTTDGIIFLKRANDSIAKIKPLEPQDYDTFAVSISGDTDNLDLGIKALTRLSVSSPGFKISGFKAGSDGEIKMVYNAGPEAVKILNNSSNSDAANRIAVYNGLDFDLPSGYGVTIVYDGTSSVWRLF